MVEILLFLLDGRDKLFITVEFSFAPPFSLSTGVLFAICYYTHHFSFSYVCVVVCPLLMLRASRFAISARSSERIVSRLRAVALPPIFRYAFAYAMLPPRPSCR